MNKKNNRKGQIFIISIIIAITVALTTSFILLSYMFKETNPDQFLGKYQSAIVDSMNDGDKILLYLDQASKMAVAKSFDEYLYGNPNPMTNVEAGDYEANYCGSYVYRQWNTVTKNCYPNYNSQSFELNNLINKNINELTKTAPSSKDEEYFDGIIRQEMNYRYSYLSNGRYTTVTGSSSDQYTVNVFKDREIAVDPNIQKYLQDKAAYSGQLIWPLPGNYNIVSCFGYRGKVNTLSGVKASLNHPGLDIEAPMDTPVLAAASGTVEEILYPRWGKVTLNHGNGLKTAYIHMNTIAEGLREGDTVKQGQVIGYVGGRGANSANDYGAHLHFEVMSSQVSLDTNYQGVNALVKGIYVNPVCFVDLRSADGTEQKLSFSTTSQACTSICSEDGGRCASVTDDVVGGAPYKFCNVYSGVVSGEAACLTGAKSDWKIDTVELSSDRLTSDQELKIRVNIINKDTSCARVVPHLVIRGQIKTDSGVKDIVIGEVFPGMSVHKNADLTPSTGEITCKFATDETAYNQFHIGTTFKKEDNTECVIPVNKDGSEIKYTVAAANIIVNDTNGHEETYDKNLDFSVRKGSSDSYASTSGTPSIPTTVTSVPNTNPTIALSNSEQQKFDQTKTNLENSGLMDYISELSQSEGIPKEIILGLITQESGGNMNADSGLAAGLMQVTKDTFDGIKFDNKCSWTQYKSDAKCQLRAGVAALKEKYAVVNGKTIYYACNVNCWGTGGSKNTNGYWSTCSNGCSPTKCIGPVTQQYDGWQAALRRYNGGGDVTAPKSGDQTSGCVGQPDYTYVEKVMKYAASWGYSDTTDKVIKEEMHIGILGKYYVDPKFNVKINFDMRLFGLLNQFANNTVSTCGKKGIIKADCIQEHIDAFNKDLPPEYKNSINMTTSCDTSKDMLDVNTFVEQVNDCMLSNDDKCQCVFKTKSNVNVNAIESVEGSTQIEYYSDNELTSSYFDYSVLKNNKYFSDTSVRLGSLSLYKDGDQLYTDINGTRDCGSVKNTFRVCLKTNYKYTVYDGSASNDKKIASKFIKIPFAITIRDGTAPAPIKGLEYNHWPHSRNAIMLKWDAGSEKDITRYNIYLSGDATYFTNQQTRYFKEVMKSKSISSIPSDYIEFRDIDLANPTCEPKDGTGYGDASGVLGGLGLAGLTASGKYCLFRYSATDKEGKPILVEISKEKLYYINSQKKFFYILDGQNTDNGLSEGMDRFIAVTAVDIDGDEIDNIETDQRITQGENLISVRPINMLEPGLTEITNLRLINGNTAIAIQWKTVNEYIDGTLISASSNTVMPPLAPDTTAKYKIYLGIGSDCIDGELKALNTLGEGLGPYEAVQEATIDISSKNYASYCVGVSTIIGSDREYDKAIVKHIVVPITPPVAPVTP